MVLVRLADSPHLKVIVMPENEDLEDFDKEGDLEDYQYDPRSQCIVSDDYPSEGFPVEWHPGNS